MGHLQDKPIDVPTKSGYRCCEFSIQTTSYTKTEDNIKKKVIDNHKVIAYGKTAKACMDLLRKGSMVLVEGNLRNQNGNSYEIRADEVSFISNYGKEDNQNG